MAQESELRTQTGSYLRLSDYHVMKVKMQSIVRSSSSGLLPNHKCRFQVFQCEPCDRRSTSGVWGLERHQLCFSQSRRVDLKIIKIRMIQKTMTSIFSELMVHLVFCATKWFIFSIYSSDMKHYLSIQDYGVRFVNGLISLSRLTWCIFFLKSWQSPEIRSRMSIGISLRPGISLSLVTVCGN